MTYDHWKTTNTSDIEWDHPRTRRSPQCVLCPYCGGNESKCDFDDATMECSEMERLFELDREALRAELSGKER